MLPSLRGLSWAGVASASPAGGFAAAVTCPALLSPLRLSVEVAGSLCMACLPWLRSTPENDPPVERGGPPRAAGARTDADAICGARNHLAQPDLPLIRDESGKANPVGS